jgi:hypothetical protein
MGQIGRPKRKIRIEPERKTPAPARHSPEQQPKPRPVPKKMPVKTDVTVP